MVVILDLDAQTSQTGGTVKNSRYILIVKGNTYIYDNLNAVYQDVMQFKLKIGEYRIFKGEEIL